MTKAPSTGLALAALLCCSCATATSSHDADPNAADARDPAAPDADPSAPDAATITADANPAAPDANNCVTLPCDLYEQCGCIPPQVCDLDDEALATGGTECRDVGTAGEDTATCSSSFGCAGGFICLGSDPGQCRRWCQEDDDCPGPGGLCILNVTYGGGTEVPGATACTKNCSPASSAPSECPPDFGCHIYLDDPDDSLPTISGDERSLTDCTSPPASGGGDSESCTYNSDCIPGYDCVNVDSVAQCKQTCVCASPGNCSGAACAIGSCYEFSDPKPIIDGVEYGVCI